MNNARKQRIVEMFNKRGEDFHALICRLPQNVVMLTGYQPILGNTFCLVTINAARDVEIRMALPVDEKDFVPPGTAVEVKTYAEETLHYIDNTIEAVREPLAELIRSAGINENAVIGHEGIYSPVAPAYTQVGVPGPATLELLHLMTGLIALSWRFLLIINNIRNTIRIREGETPQLGGVVRTPSGRAFKLGNALN